MDVLGRLLISIYFITAGADDTASETVPIPSNCIGLSDGHYYLKLLEGDQFPVLYAKCSNEHIIIDYHLDEDVKYYFNSFEKFHVSVAGPSNANHVNWQSWFLPNTDSSDHGYLISPDCNTCAVYVSIHYIIRFPIIPIYCHHSEYRIFQFTFIHFSDDFIQTVHHTT